MGEDRELSPWREFCEELITTTNIIKADNFRYINYKYKGRVTSPIIRLDVGGRGYFQYDIFDLVPNDAQTKELEVLYGSGDGEIYRWFTAEQIKARGYDQRTKMFIANILPHSKYSLEIKWSKKAINLRYEAIFNPDNIDHDCEELVKTLVAR